MKTETVEEFLARGGEMSTHDYIPPEEKQHVLKPIINGPPPMYSLDDAAHFFAEKRKLGRSKKPPDLSKIDRDKIPVELHGILERLEQKEKQCDQSSTDTSTSN